MVCLGDATGTWTGRPATAIKGVGGARSGDARRRAVEEIPKPDTKRLQTTGLCTRLLSVLGLNCLIGDTGLRARDLRGDTERARSAISVVRSLTATPSTKKPVPAATALGNAIIGTVGAGVLNDKAGLKAHGAILGGDTDRGRSAARSGTRSVTIAPPTQTVTEHGELGARHGLRGDMGRAAVR